jgi:hypothetical protein
MRADGMIVFDDQVMELVEKSIGVSGVRNRYFRKKNHSWIKAVRIDEIRIALTELDDDQLTIIELLVFEVRSPLDVRQKLEMTSKDLRAAVRNIRCKLLNAM